MSYIREAAESLVGHPDVDLISFTGGTATGKKVATTAAPLVNIYIFIYMRLIYKLYIICFMHELFCIFCQLFD